MVGLVKKVRAYFRKIRKQMFSLLYTKYMIKKIIKILNYYITLISHNLYFLVFYYLIDSYR